MILRRPTLFLFLFLALQCAVTGLTAQETQRGIEVIEEQPRFEDSAAPVLEFDRTPVLPPSSLPTGDQLAAVPVVFVRQIVLDGSGVLSAEEVAGVVTPYEGRDVSIEELNEVRTRLSLLYFDKGFVNSGVVLPDQKITDGVIRFEEVLGRLSAVQLEGDGRLEEA